MEAEKKEKKTAKISRELKTLAAIDRQLEGCTPEEVKRILAYLRDKHLVCNGPYPIAFAPSMEAGSESNSCKGPAAYQH